MKIINQSFEIQTTTQMEFIDVTLQVQEIVDNSGIREGNCLVFIPHATMGIVVNQNEPMLLQDFMRVLYKLVPVDDQYSHDLFELPAVKRLTAGATDTPIAKPWCWEMMLLFQS